MDAAKVVAAAREAPGIAAGRPDQPLIAEGAAVGGGDAALLRIDGNDLGAGDERDRPLLPERSGPDQKPLERLFAREILLRERRPLIRQLRLLAEDGDAPLELQLAKRDRRLCAAMAAADDDGVEAFHASASTIVTLAMPPPSHIVWSP
jgi:hypothetical protein